MRLRAFTILLCITSAASAIAAPDAIVASILARMDQAAAKFKTMTADVTTVYHTDVINEDRTETGTVVMKKVAAGEVQGLLRIQSPDKKIYSFEKRRFRIYLPKINTVQEWNLGKYGEQLDQFVMIGFGTSGTALAKDYDVTSLGTETVKAPEDVKTIRLQLLPKTGEAREHIKKLELWIPESDDPYPVQEKISLTSGDYKLVTYTHLMTNVPLAPDALQLKPAPGFITQYPGK